MSMLSGKWRNYYGVILLFKLLLTYINAYYPGSVPMSGIDCVNFTRDALVVLSDANGFFGIFQSDATLFTKETAAVYYFLGVNHVYVYYLVCFCSLIAFKYMVKMAKEMTNDDELAQKCGILFLVWPILLVHASTFLRENQCNLLFILSFYCFVRFVKKHNPVSFAGAIFWAVLAAMTHSGLIALVICYCIFGSMVSKSGEIKLSPVKIAFGFLLVLGLMSSSFSDSMTEKFKGAEDARSVEEFVDVVSTERAEEAATQYIGSRPSNPIKLLLLEPYLLLMFIFSPFPHQVHSVGQGISFLIESIPQFLIVRATYMYLVVERTEGTSQVKGYKTMGLWTLALFYFIFSLGTTCYGTAIRHRAKITPLLIVFAVMYYAEKKGVAVGRSKEEESDEESTSATVYGKSNAYGSRSRKFNPFVRGKPSVNVAKYGKLDLFVRGKPSGGLWFGRFNQFIRNRSGLSDAKLRKFNPFVKGKPGVSDAKLRKFNPFVKGKPGVNGVWFGKLNPFVRGKPTSMMRGSLELPKRPRKK